MANSRTVSTATSVCRERQRLRRRAQPSHHPAASRGCGDKFAWPCRPTARHGGLCPSRPPMRAASCPKTRLQIVRHPGGGIETRPMAGGERRDLVEEEQLRVVAPHTLRWRPLNFSTQQIHCRDAQRREPSVLSSRWNFPPRLPNRVPARVSQRDHRTDRPGLAAASPVLRKHVPMLLRPFRKRRPAGHCAAMPLQRVRSGQPGWPRCRHGRPTAK